MPRADAKSAPDHEVVVMGAGVSGLCMAIALRRAGTANVVVLEQSSGLGGTWWDNRYPGAQVDVPAPLYCFSFAPNPRWRRRFATADEIQAYLQHCAARFRVIDAIRFDSRIVAATFDAAAGLWRIEVDSRHGATATRSTLSARFFVCSTGPLSRARWPDVPGLETFAGDRVHSAQWPRDLPLQGRRIAVIGTGSTAAQLVPPLARQAARLHVFQRTANWVLPRIDRRYNAIDRVLARLPPYSRAVRAFWRGVLEWGRRGFDDGTLARRSLLAAAAAHLRRGVAEPALREQLVPNHPLGCKRIIYSNDFYPALAQPHVELVAGAVQRVEPTGVVGSDGVLREVDLLVCATGFDVEHSLAAVAIRGRGGRLLADAWADGPEARLGLTVAGFPNLFLMLGPNTATGHTSTLLFIEPGVRWVVRAMREVRRRQRRWIDLRPAVMRDFNDRLQQRLTGSVWSACRSWYRAANGRVIAIWPGFTREYVRAVRRQSFDDFEFG